MDLSGITRDAVLPVRVDPSGKVGPTPDQARGPRWRRSSRGLYVPAEVDRTGVSQRIVEAAAVLPDDWGAVTGWAALAWMGGTWFDGTPWGGGPTRPVDLVIGNNRLIRPQRGIATSEERLLERDVIVVDGLRVTIPARSVCFAMRYARDVWDAVTTLDMACFSDVVSIDEAAAYANTIPGWTGIPLCRDEALALAVENSWSPREPALRRAWRAAMGRVPLRCNVPVFGPGGVHLGTPDLIDPVAGVVGEYDGDLHLVRDRRDRDETRDHEFRAHGLVDVTMLAGDVSSPEPFRRRLTWAYERAAELPPARRRWTLEPPDWWIDTTTVAARRALSESQRQRLLAHRAA
ncbi:hypothetical protein [Nocardioides sp. SR21]|uniref:hypothetical protein n=1 Tax=Nocardioides sp. SR21 TaxID=2919501 RepID=UPI001FAAC874|nr:hypothetical protein [Nocardioides sp. SR21]